MRYLVHLVIVTTFLSAASPLRALTDNEKSHVRATKAHTAPHVDGVLDDPVWQRAYWHSSFVQRRPVNGAEPTQKTAFAVAHDDETIYFAVRCSVPDKHDIVTRLVRRDQEGDFDHVEVTLAPREDGRTGYSFAVNPDGVQKDRVWNDDSNSDVSWDAVWDVETQINEQEWTAEFAIPLDQIRFPDGKTSWGLQIGRWIAALQEHDVWSPVPTETNGWISTAGTLTGVEEIKAQKPSFIIPESYLAYRDSTAGFGSRSTSGFTYGVGGYAKVGLIPDLVLDVAVNPDFGQVEVDEVVLNLSAYETRFPEKRPFFLESAGLFQTPIPLFYSRRLGAPPPDPVLQDNESVKTGPSATPILTAFKLTGRTEQGLSAGVIEAVLLPTQFTVKNNETGQTERRRSTPFSNAMTLRLVAETGDSGSTIGVLGTALNPEGSDGAYAGGVDLNLFFKDREYSLRSQLAGTVRFDDVFGQEESHGTALWTQFAREGGTHLRFWAFYEIYGKGFDPNDLGYTWRDDLQHGLGHVQYRHVDPLGPFAEIYTGIGIERLMNIAALNLGQHGWWYFSTKWANHFWSEVGLVGGLDHNDDRETRGGPHLKRSAWGGGWLNVSTPQNKPIGGRLAVEVRSTEFGYHAQALTALDLRLGRLELSLAPGLKHTEGSLAYVDTLNAETPDEMTIIARRDLDEFNVTFKGTLVLVRDLAFQLQSQLLSVRADHSDYRHLVDSDTREPYDYNDASADFSRVDLNFQAMLRWQFLPGSALYLVYTHTGFAEIVESGPSLGRALTSLDDEEREQLLMLKLSYLFG